MRTLTLQQHTEAQPGDVVVALNGHQIQPRTVREVGLAGVITDPPEGHTDTIDWVIYPGRTLTVQRKPRARGHKSLEAAARAWGNARGIKGLGGSLYWQAETSEEAKALAKKAGGHLNVKRMDNTFTRFLVINYGRYGARGHDKGWQSLGETLLDRRVLVKRGDKYFPREG